MGLLRVQFEISTTLAPEFGDAFDELDEAGPAIARLGREIGSTIERFQIRREEDAHRPAARAGRGLDERHVNLVHVGALLAVHLDADEVAVERGGGGFGLEGFAFHDVAPMAGGVADAEEDGLALGARLGERLIAPREPVHGIVRVLEEIGRLLAG